MSEVTVYIRDMRTDPAYFDDSNFAFDLDIDIGVLVFGRRCHLGVVLELLPCQPRESTLPIMQQVSLGGIGQKQFSKKGQHALA
jgi:hypothetical protein